MLFAIVEVHQRFEGPELKQALVSADTLKQAASEWRLSLTPEKRKAISQAFCTQKPIGMVAYNEPHSAQMSAADFLAWVKTYTRYAPSDTPTPPLFTEISTGKVIE